MNEKLNFLSNKEADVRKQKSLLSEANEHSKQVQKEIEKRLEETEKEKNKLEKNFQEKNNELQALKSEMEISQADKHSTNQVFYFFL